MHGTPNSSLNGPSKVEEAAILSHFLRETERDTHPQISVEIKAIFLSQWREEHKTAAQGSGHSGY